VSNKENDCSLCSYRDLDVDDVCTRKAKANAVITVYDELIPLSHRKDACRKKNNNTLQLTSLVATPGALCLFAETVRKDISALPTLQIHQKNQNACSKSEIDLN